MAKKYEFNSTWKDAIFKAKVGDVFVTSQRGWPKFKKIARACGYHFSDTVEVHNGFTSHTLTRIKMRKENKHANTRSTLRTRG